MADEFEIFIAAHFGVSPEIHEIWELAITFESAPSNGEDPSFTDALVVASVGIEGLLAQEHRAYRGCILVSESHRVARDWTELSEHCGLLHERDTDGYRCPVSKELCSVLVLLELSRLVGEALVVEAFVEMEHAPGEFDPPESVEGVDSEYVPATYGLHGKGVIPIQKTQPWTEEARLAIKK